MSNTGSEKRTKLYSYGGEIFLQIPKQGFGPMLLLEFIQTKQTGVKLIIKEPKDDSNCLLINMQNLILEDYQQAIYYINSNL